MTIGTENNPVDLTTSKEESSEGKEFILSKEEEGKDFNNHEDYRDQFEENYFENNPSGIHLSKQE